MGRREYGLYGGVDLVKRRLELATKAAKVMDPLKEDGKSSYLEHVDPKRYDRSRPSAAGREYAEAALELESVAVAAEREASRPGTPQSDREAWLTLAIEAHGGSQKAIESAMKHVPGDDSPMKHDLFAVILRQARPVAGVYQQRAALRRGTNNAEGADSDERSATVVHEFASSRGVP